MKIFAAIVVASGIIAMCLLRLMMDGINMVDDQLDEEL